MTREQSGGGSGGETPFPRPGQILRNFALLSSAGKQVQLADYRGRANLVLVFAGAQQDEAGLALLSQLARQDAEILEQEAQVIAVLFCDRERAEIIRSRRQWPFVTLADSEGTVHRTFGALDSQGAARLGVYVTDRYAEVFAAYRTAHGDPAPSSKDIVEWLEFVNKQCPECFPPEWPA